MIIAPEVIADIDQESEVVRIVVKPTNENVENEVIRNISRNNFLAILAKEEIDINFLINEKKKDNTMFHKFNFLLKDLHDIGTVDIVDAITYLEDDFKYKDIFKCLNSENMLILRAIMANKFRVKSKIASIKIEDL